MLFQSTLLTILSSKKFCLFCELVTVILNFTDDNECQESTSKIERGLALPGMRTDYGDFPGGNSG